MHQVQRLTARFGRQTPAPETLHYAASFISQVHDTIAVGGPDWQAPAVEVGEDGTAVFLWQDGLRGLSLVVGQDGSGSWVCAPGHSPGDIAALDFTSRLFQGTATPDEFARDVWSPWMRAEAPFV